MPRKRRMKGRGSSELTSIATANRNLRLLNNLESAKPPLQQPGQVINVPIIKQGFGKRRKRKMKGGAFLTDKYGAFVHNF